MAVEIEGVVHLNTLEATLWVILGQLGKNVDLQLGSVPIFLDVANNFNSDHFVFSNVVALDHFAKGSFSQLFQYFVPAATKLLILNTRKIQIKFFLPSNVAYPATSLNKIKN